MPRALTAAAKDALLKLHNATSQLVQVRRDDAPATSVVISEFNYCGHGEYLEPSSGHKFLLDPLDLSTAALPDPVEGIQYDEALYQAAHSYATRTYKAASVGVYPVGGGETVVLLVGTRADPKNCWSGQWKSVWTLKDGVLSGQICVAVHFWEDGNIQLSASKTVGTSSAADSPAVVKTIEDAELAFQLAMNEAYQTLSQSTFKRLRRQLPITRTKMDWSKVGAYGLGSELRHQAK